MKSAPLTLILIIVAVIGLHAFRMLQSSGIRGTLLPADGVSQIIAIHGRDSLRAVSGREGFFVQARPGKWDILIDAAPPYKDIWLKHIEVKNGRVKDLGEIKLRK